MDFIAELEWRNLLHDKTPGVEERLKKGPTKAYIGFDPTAPSLTIGNYVQVMSLRRFQLAGHTPVILMGGATGRIGDPSGKDKERDLKTTEELDKNLFFQQKQMEKFFDFGKSAQIVNNYDFYKEMNVLDFLRDVGKTLTVNYMMSKDSVKNRLDSGLSFTEFSYQLLQAYDFQVLYEKHGCEIQMGGSDQWGNITSGTEFIRRNTGGKAYAVTTPLLTKSDGKKFGKSEKGNIWLDPNLTSPYEFFQFWINADDADLPNYFRTFSMKSKVEIEGLEEEYNSNPNELKRILAEELTTEVHSSEAFQSAKSVSNLLFNRKAGREDLLRMSQESLDLVSSELETVTIEKNVIENNSNLIDLLTDHTGFLSSKGEARRAIQNNAISINKNKISNLEAVITTDSLLHGKYIMVENGKKNKFIIKLKT
jgi:tyrosyl-tRNA synthetase